MQPLDPSLKTRRWLTVGLTVSGALGGAVFGVVLTRLAKVIAEAPPGTPGEYAWNAAVFAVIAGFVSPVVSWAAFRRVPLWRTVVEPLAGAVAAAGTAVVIGVPALILVLPPLGLALSFASLARRYREPRSLPSIRPANER